MELAPLDAQCASLSDSLKLLLEVPAPSWIGLHVQVLRVFFRALSIPSEPIEPSQSPYDSSWPNVTEGYLVMQESTRVKPFSFAWHARTEPSAEVLSGSKDTICSCLRDGQKGSFRRVQKAAGRTRSNPNPLNRFRSALTGKSRRSPVATTSFGHQFNGRGRQVRSRFPSRRTEDWFVTADLSGLVVRPAAGSASRLIQKSALPYVKLTESG